MSLRKSIFSPRACSGLMYSGVPITRPVAVAEAASPPHSFAMPKSISRTWPRASRMMFGVFRSRWMMPTVVDRLQAVRDLQRGA